MNPEQKLKELYGLELPAMPSPGGVYSLAVQTGNLLYIAGQTPMKDGALAYKGVVGRDFTVEEGQQAAQICALNVLAIIKDKLGSLERVKQFVQLVGYVRCAPDFGQQPQVVNGASQLFKDIFGEAGLPVRLAIGANELPGGAAVEIITVVEVL